MVRHLALNFLYNRIGTRSEIEPEGVCLAVALASADSKKTGGSKMASLSKVTFPFWIVQTSPTKSIAIAAFSSIKQEFKLSEMKGSGEIRRIVSSDVSQSEDIPKAASKIRPLLDRVETVTADIPNLINPTTFTNVANYIETLEPSVQPNRLEIQIDSNVALKRTEEFREISNAAQLRIEATESLRKLIQDKFGDQKKILENLAKLELDRWNDRVKTMEERSKQEIIDLTKKKDDQLYALREKHKMNLRAMTAEFSRTTNDLEKFFTEIVDEIRDARTQIGEKEDNVEGAITIYSELVSKVKKRVERSTQPLETLESKKQTLRNQVESEQKEYNTKITEIEKALKAQITDHENRIESTKKEMIQKMKEFDEIKSKVNSAIEETDEALESRIIGFQKEFLDLMSWTLDNNSISEIAPLTHLDINTYVAKFDDNSYSILTPSMLPESGSSKGVKIQSLDVDFDRMITSLIDERRKTDRAFKDAFDRACVRGNVFINAESKELLSEGLRVLISKNLLNTDDKTRYENLWSKYSGKCPKCGAITEIGAKFCQKCGLDLS
ncbi:MAG: hypothetical protein JW779_03585 [Candidatus Thorarchaeota archaeon]|nr:hypothetical protein [Candidatus Thorarchaeota archaeon]